jgi:hypothetical protein
MKRITRIIPVFAIASTIALTSLSACGTVTVSIEDPIPTTTAIAAAQATDRARLATKVAIQQATLGVTPGPTSITVDATNSLPAPIPGDTPGVFYQSIPLANAAYAPSGFASPLTGQHTLAEIPFELSADIFKSQSSSLPNAGYPTSIQFSTDIPAASRAYLLLNTGNGFAQFEGQAIGQVTVRCGGTSIIVTELRLGQDVREWHLAHNVVYTADRTQQVWTGALAEYPHLTGHIDMLILDLTESCRNGRLTSLEIADTSAGIVGSLDPALNLFGITIEYRQ